MRALRNAEGPERKGESEPNGGQGSVAKRRLLATGMEAKYLQTCPGLILLLRGWFDELQVSLT